jgi:hypothetical protein
MNLKANSLDPNYGHGALILGQGALNFGQVAAPFYLSLAGD